MVRKYDGQTAEHPTPYGASSWPSENAMDGARKRRERDEERAPRSERFDCADNADRSLWCERAEPRDWFLCHSETQGIPLSQLSGIP